MILILLISWLLLSVSVKGNECLLKFREEPPTQLNCNPYHDDDDDGESDDDDVDEEWRLRLACEVRLPADIGPVQYEVHWFQRNNESIIIDHGRPDGFQKTNQAERITFGLSWYNQKFTTGMLGDYWCQAILTDRQPPVYLSKSNILTVRKPDYYDSNLPKCRRVQFSYTNRCIPNITVVLPSSSETLSLISITVSIFPTPTLTMRDFIDLKTNTILGHSSIRTHLINLISKSEQLQLSSSTSHQSTTPVSINNDTNYLLTTILSIIITLTIVSSFIIIILVVTIRVKRKKTRSSDSPIPNQTSNETQDNDNKDRTSINMTELYYYIVPDSSSTTSYYTAQDPDNPQYQSLKGSIYESIYDNANTHHKYAAINPNQVEKNVYSSLRNKTTIK